MARLHVAAAGALSTIREIEPLTWASERDVQHAQFLLEGRFIRAAVAPVERTVVRQPCLLEPRQEDDPPFAAFGGVNGAEPRRLPVGLHWIDVLTAGERVEPLAQTDLRSLGDRAQARDGP